MTNSDLRDARDELDARVQSRRSRDRRLVLAAVAAVVAVVGAFAGWRALDDKDSAPSTTTPADTEPSDEAPSDLTDSDRAFLRGTPPIPDTLRGLWRLDNPTDSRMLMMFTPDGKVAYDDTGQLTGNPLVSGTYAIDDDLVTVAVTGGQAGCSGQELGFRGAMNGGGTVHLIPVDAEPTSCDRPFRTQWVLERVLPAYVYADFAPPPGRRWDPPAGPEALLGTWLAGNANYVIEVLEDGRYVTLAGVGEVVDRGTWVAADDTSALVLTSSADSPSCDEGDRLMVTNLRTHDIGALAMQGDIQRDDCALAPWLGWVLLAGP